MADNSAVAVDDRQYVTFKIAEETYGLPVIRVQSINEMTKITRLPNTAPFIKGMINLRGVVIPVIDMRLKFQMPERDYDSFNVIIIVEVKERLIGFIADTVSDVLSIPVESIQETPHFSAKIKTDFIEGIGRRDDDLVIILDVDKILSVEEIEMLDSGRGSAGEANDKK